MSRAGAVLIALVCLAAAACDRGARAGDELAADELAVLGQVPDLALTDQTGARLRTADLAGRVLIVNFIFTRCPTVCPVTSLKMKRLGEQLAGEERVALVSISVDPEHDTPEVLRAFAARYGADPARWRFLTGEAEALRRAVEEGFKLELSRRGALADGTPDIVHDLHFVLVDRQLRIRGYYDSGEAERLAALARDARRLAGE
jgi:protein SCO1/2